MVGCQESEEFVTDPELLAPQELPDVPALKDEFTREFITSVEQTEGGYYPFESGTHQYRFCIWGEGVVGQSSYSIEEERFEAIYIGVGKQQVNTRIRIEYYGDEVYPSLETSQFTLEGTVGEELAFTKEEMKNSALFLAPYKNDDPKRKGYVVIIDNPNRKESLWIRYSIELKDENNGKKAEIFEEETANFYKWLNTVEFMDSN